MTSYPDDFNQIANDILSTINEEIGYRTAANRAYYSAFHEAHSFAYKATNYQPPQKRPCLGHAYLINLLKDHKKNLDPRCLSQEDKTLQKVGVWLGQCFDLRVKADYRLSIMFSYLQASDALKLTGNILNSLKKIKIP